jgi:IclR family transcriptional regulator, mhp operon transcriptional activator
MKDDQIRSVARALSLLNAMNAEPSTSLHQLHLQLGLPKATLSRLLTTLIAEGYVQAEGVAGRYRLTAKVQELAAGYTPRSLIVDVGSPLALRVTKEIRWPLAIGTLDGDAVVVRFSTMPYSPLAVHATTLGQRLGLLDTAMGRVYLAHCEEQERRALLELLAAASPGGQLVGARALDADLRLIRHQGYAVRMPNARRTSATIAVPVVGASGVLATLCLTTFGRLMTHTMIRQHLPVLCDTAQAMSHAYEARAAQGRLGRSAEAA